MALTLEIDIDERGFVKGVRNVNQKLTGMDKTAKKKSKSMVSSLGNVKSMLIGIGAVSVAATIKGLIDLASTAQETQNKFDVVFKGVSNASKAIDELSDKTGYANSSLNNMMASLGDLIKPAGFAADEAFRMSESITKLSLDIASFNPGTTGIQVVNDFKSAIAGSAETLIKYGIDVKESSIAQKAYEMGLISSIKAYSSLDAATKRSVRIQALIAKGYDNSKDALGDLARTQGSYKNQSMQMGEQLKELGEALGKFFIPAATDAVKLITDAVKWFNEFLAIGDNKPKSLLEVSQEDLKNLQLILDNHIAINNKLEVRAGLSYRAIALKKEELTYDKLIKMYGEDTIEYLQAEYNILNNNNEVVRDKLNTAIKNLEVTIEDIKAKEKADQLDINKAKRLAEFAEARRKALDGMLSIERDISFIDKEREEMFVGMYDTTLMITEEARKKAEEELKTKGILKEQTEAQEYQLWLLKEYLESIPNRTAEQEYQLQQLKETLSLMEAQKVKMRDIGEEANRAGLSIQHSITDALADALVEGRNLADTLRDISKMALKTAIQFGFNALLGFQHGGSFKVGGMGGPDSQLVAFKATPGETVTVSPNPTYNSNTNNMNLNFNFAQSSEVDDWVIKNQIIPAIRKHMTQRGALLN